jgi:hypothetical protein
VELEVRWGIKFVLPLEFNNLGWESAGLGTLAIRLALTSFVWMLILVALGVAVCLTNDRIQETIFRRRNPPEKIAAERRAFENRIASPDWVFYERHLQRPAPSALRVLYADHSFVCAEGHEYDETHYISTFEPLDEKTLAETVEFFGREVVPFANSDGDIIYLLPGANESDVVYITYHDGGDTGKLAPDVRSFLERVRGANREGFVT